MKGMILRARFAGGAELPVILGARGVVMVAKKMRGRERNASKRENIEFDKPRRAAIAIAKGMNPCEIQMRDDLSALRIASSRRRSERE